MPPPLGESGQCRSDAAQSHSPHRPVHPAALYIRCVAYAAYASFALLILVSFGESLHRAFSCFDNYCSSALINESMRLCAHRAWDNNLEKTDFGQFRDFFKESELKHTCFNCTLAVDVEGCSIKARMVEGFEKVELLIEQFEEDSQVLARISAVTSCVKKKMSTGEIRMASLFPVCLPWALWRTGVRIFFELNGEGGIVVE
jgi:hypothetical protein